MDSTSSYSDLAKSLLEKTTQFAEHLKTLTQVNDELKEKCEKALTALSTVVGSSATSPASCPICFARQRTHVLVPCGHIFCGSCSTRACRRGRCHSCRGTVDSNLRVFL